MNYEIKFNPTENNKPYMSFDEDNDFWHLHELNSCDTEYILDDIMPNIEKIRNGEKYWDPYRSPHYGALDDYSFGYDATIIDFGKDRSIISYEFGDKEIEVPSEEIYAFMKAWADALRKWKNDQQK